MERHEGTGGVVVGPGVADLDDDVRSPSRVVVMPSSPGWGWFVGVVLVSLALWAGLIWLGFRVASWFS